MERDKMRIQSILNANDKIQQWNMDLKDVDCILRVVSEALAPQQIISLIKNNGFECSELD